MHSTLRLCPKDYYYPMSYGLCICFLRRKVQARFHKWRVSFIHAPSNILTSVQMDRKDLWMWQLWGFFSPKLLYKSNLCRYKINTWGNMPFTWWFAIYSDTKYFTYTTSYFYLPPKRLKCLATNCKNEMQIKTTFNSLW